MSLRSWVMSGVLLTGICLHAQSKTGSVLVGQPFAALPNALAMTLRHHRNPNFHWTHAHVSEQCFGIPRFLRTAGDSVPGDACAADLSKISPPRPTCANSGKYQSPLFLFSSETNGAIGHPIVMFMQPLPPHLVTRAASKSCSVCGHEFPANSQPLLRNVFEEHVRTMHIAKRPLPRSVHRRVGFIKNVA